VTVVVRYAPVLRRLHWLMAVLVATGYLLIEQRGLFPRGSGGRFAMMQGHYWVGMSIFALALWRLLARRKHGAPDITPALPRLQALPAMLLHVALYAFFIVMPLLGLATAWLDGKQVFIPFTQVALPALLAGNESMAHTVEDLHGQIGEIFYWVIGLHIVASLYHHFIRRDDTLARMR
jgi:superoxide oxidase